MASLLLHKENGPRPNQKRAGVSSTWLMLAKSPRMTQTPRSMATRTQIHHQDIRLHERFARIDGLKRTAVLMSLRSQRQRCVRCIRQPAEGRLKLRPRLEWEVDRGIKEGMILTNESSRAISCNLDWFLVLPICRFLLSHILRVSLTSSSDIQANFDHHCIV